MSKVLFIDNFDSFTYNLTDELRRFGCDVQVYRNDAGMESIDRVVGAMHPDFAVISPGPGNPQSAGIIIPFIEKYHERMPLFGVCLGHQAIVEAFGGRVARAPQAMHGKSSKITHDGRTIYDGLPNPVSVARYHSLSGYDIPECLEVTARTDDGVVMGIRHRDYPVEGVQFHPESVLTPEGRLMLRNLVKRGGRYE